jgi:hypothetical protein
MEDQVKYTPKQVEEMTQKRVEDNNTFRQRKHEEDRAQRQRMIESSCKMLIDDFNEVCKNNEHLGKVVLRTHVEFRKYPEALDCFHQAIGQKGFRASKVTQTTMRKLEQDPYEYYSYDVPVDERTFTW